MNDGQYVGKVCSVNWVGEWLDYCHLIWKFGLYSYTIYNTSRCHRVGSAERSSSIEMETIQNVAPTGTQDVALIVFGKLNFKKQFTYCIYMYKYCIY